MANAYNYGQDYYKYVPGDTTAITVRMTPLSATAG